MPPTLEDASTAPVRTRIKVITFDWGDTLAANYGMPYLAVQRRAFTRLGLDLTGLGGKADGEFADRCLQDLAHAWTSSIDPQRNPEHREFDFRAMLDGWVRRAVGLDADPHQLRLAIERCTNTLADTVIPYGDAAAALSACRARGYRIGILSHVPWPGDACRSWFRRHGLSGLIDFYSLSCEVGWIKPSHRHYQHALDLAGCAPAEILHVGDHPLRDIEGARAFGFRTCLRHTENVYPQEAIDRCRPDAEIVLLKEVLDVAARLS